ncbi:MAG: cation-translocating P-type ATPase [Planctomycetota bacterium]
MPETDRQNQQDEPWSQPAEQLCASLEVEPEQGLASAQAEQRLEQDGPNRISGGRRRPWWKIALEQFKSVVILILLVAGIVAFATARLPEGLAILAVLLINAAIGFVSEFKAHRSMQALRQRGRHIVEVVRDGETQEIPAAQLVRGDIVILDQGDRVPADCRIIEARQVRVDESALTGESVPVGKTAEPVEPDAPLAERTCMLYMGTKLTEGQSRTVVAATGRKTQLGQISEMTASAEDKSTPLEKRLNSLGWKLAIATLTIAAGIGVIGWRSGHELVQIIETSLALGVAAVPEGLAIVATIALARGMYMMAQRNALVQKLASMETLGATGLIITDKTGTLTENRLTVRKILTPDESWDVPEEEDQAGDPPPSVRRAIEIGVLCNDAVLAENSPDDEPVGDPTELALLSVGRKVGLDRPGLVEEKPETRMEAFNPEDKKMATFHDTGQSRQVCVKGAPEQILEICTRCIDGDGQSDFGSDQREHWNTQAEQLAADGLRVLALADKTAETDQAAPYEDLRFVGLVGLYDPPREGVGETIGLCRDAGISVKMATGDRQETGQAIGAQVGIGEGDRPRAMNADALPDLDSPDDQDKKRVIETHIFSRVSPAQKIDLVELHQQAGQVVAMTGDGVNDAPALKQADIGVAMGQRGTEAARQAADMVLLDDAFSSIVEAIRYGRVIFDNIRKAILFMLCTNGAEVLAVAVASAGAMVLPLRPLQILYLNVLTDVLPALALGVSTGTGNAMQRDPRDPEESILTGKHWLFIAIWSFILAGVVLAGLNIALHGLGLTTRQAVTVSFLTLAFAKLVFPFGLRDVNSPWLKNEITTNRWLWGAIAACTVLLLAAVYLPGLNSLLSAVGPGLGGWALVGVLSLAVLLIGQLVLAIRKIVGW